MERNLGTQPLDGLMNSLNLTTANLVEASDEQLSFKMVQRARKGRLLTLNIQNKILNAFRNAKPAENFERKDLFNYV